MKKTARQKAKEFVEAFNNVKWELKFAQGGFDSRVDLDDYKLFPSLIGKPHNWKKEINDVHIYVGLVVKPIEYILKKVQLGSETIRISSKKIDIPFGPGVKYKGDGAFDYWDELLPVWTQHYHEEIMPEVERFRDLQKINAYDLEMQKTKKFIGAFTQHGMFRRLIVKKLVNDTQYEELKRLSIERYELLINDPQQIKWQDGYSINLKKLKFIIQDLDNLDVGYYLHSKPWRINTPRSQTQKRSPIISEQVSVMIIDKKLDNKELETILGKTIVAKGKETAAEAAEIGSSGDIHVLSGSNNTIVFLHDIGAISSWDWSQMSTGHMVLGFMIMETATHSYQIEYWQKGECLLSRMEIDDEVRVKDEGELQERFGSQNTLSVIKRLFSDMTGGGLDELYEDQVVVRYGME